MSRLMLLLAIGGCFLCGGPAIVRAADSSLADSPPGVVRLSDGSGWNGHLQGVATDGVSLFWSWTRTLVKSDLAGNVLCEVEVARHHGDLCVKEGVLYVAVNLGDFNHPSGTAADSWVYAYDASTLAFRAKWAVPELIWGAGGMTSYGGRFYLVGGLPNGVEGNALYEYASDFRFLRKISLPIGWTNLGIQAVDATEAGWFRFGVYGRDDMGEKPYALMCWFGDLDDPAAYIRINAGNPAVGILRLKGYDFTGNHWIADSEKGLWSGSTYHVKEFLKAETQAMREWKSCATSTATTSSPVELDFDCGSWDVSDVGIDLFCEIRRGLLLLLR